MSRLALVVWMAWCCTTAGCASGPPTMRRADPASPLAACWDAPERTPGKKGAKKLFEWAVGQQQKKDGKDQNGTVEDASLDGTDEASDDAAEDEADNDEIVTDRPDFTEASTTVGRGRIQLEAGYTFTSDREFGSKCNSHSYPEMLWRIGMLAEWFELRIGQNFGTLYETAADGKVDNPSGAEDLYLGIKLALTAQQKALPEMALILQTTVPTGVKAFSAQQICPGFNLCYGWDIHSWLACGGSTQVNRNAGAALPGFAFGFEEPAPAPGFHYHVDVAQSFTINYQLTRKLGAYTEYFGIYPCGGVDPDVLPENYLDGGFTYKLRPNVQLDLRAGVGLNQHADDYFVGSGFSVRY